MTPRAAALGLFAFIALLAACSGNGVNDRSRAAPPTAIAGGDRVAADVHAASKASPGTIVVLPGTTASPSTIMVLPGSTATPSTIVVLPGSTATPSTIVVLPGSTATPSTIVVLPGTSPTPVASPTPMQMNGFSLPDQAMTHVLRNPHFPVLANGVPAVQIPGYHPSDLASAYKVVPQSAGALVAIVDAFDDPAIEADLALYRATFGLPPCTSANGCFRKVQDGHPPFDAGWSVEIALDVEMVSALCPSCSIVLVEAQTANLKDLSSAENVAAAYRPAAISNSFYASEAGIKKDYSAAFVHPGITVVAATGDGSAGPTFPADVPSVTAVGGTTLLPDQSARGWSETAWSGAGYGCSTRYPQPAWQGVAWCAQRWSPDVSAVADPSTGVAVYSSYMPGGAGGWIVSGGTSAATPIIAALHAIASGGGTPHDVSYVYAHRDRLFFLHSSAQGQLGLGSPNGSGAF